jgi:hypothetical protein
MHGRWQAALITREKMRRYEGEASTGTIAGLAGEYS